MVTRLLPHRFLVGLANPITESRVRSHWWWGVAIGVADIDGIVDVVVGMEVEVVDSGMEE